MHDGKAQRFRGGFAYGMDLNFPFVALALNAQRHTIGLHFRQFSHGRAPVIGREGELILLPCLRCEREHTTPTAHSRHALIGYLPSP